MAETIEIFKLNIDVDAAIAGSAQLKKEAAGLKAQLDSMKGTARENSEEFVRLDATYKSVNKQYGASQREIGKMLQLKGKEIKTVEQGRNALTILNKEWAKQAKLYGANSKEADVLAKKHLELKNRVNELQKGIGDTSGNIGNYSADIVDAAGKTSLFGRATSIVNSILQVAKPIYNAIKLEITGISTAYKVGVVNAKAFSGAQKAAAIGTNLMSAALKLLKIALIATGIGAIVVLLGSLIAYFSKTQKGVDAVNKIMAALGAAFDVIIDRISAFGGAVIKFFSGDFTGGFNDMKDALSGIGDELEREIGLAYELETALIALKEKEIGLIVTQSARKKKIEELRLAAKDELTDLKERAKFLEQAGELEKAILADKLSIAEEEARISQGKLDLGESTREDIKANAELQAKVIDLETESLKLQRSIEAEKQGLMKRARAEQASAAKERIALSKKAMDAAIAESKTRLKLYEEQNREQAKTLVDGVKVLEQIRDKRLAILQQEIDAGKKTETEAELERLKIKNSFLDEQKELVIDFAYEELEIYKSANESRIEQGQLLNDSLVDLETQRLAAIAEKEKEFQSSRLEEGLINQREYNEAIKAIDEEYRASKEDVDNQLREQQLEREAVDFENSQALKIERDGLIFEAKLAELERNYQSELEYAEKIGANTTLVDEKFAALRTQIKEDEAKSKLDIQKSLFGGVAELLGKETVAGKAAGIASATINAYQGVSEVLRAKTTIPEPFGTIQKIVSSGIVLGTGLKAVKNIAKTNTSVPKAEKGMLIGGLLNGARHSQGGIPIEAEGGEYVVNRRATKLFYPLIDKMNQIGNGNSGLNTSGFMMDGGLIGRSISPNTNGVAAGNRNTVIDYERIGLAVADGVKYLPSPVTDVKDIIAQVSNYNSIVDGASI